MPAFRMMAALPSGPVKARAPKPITPSGGEATVFCNFIRFKAARPSGLVETEGLEEVPKLAIFMLFYGIVLHENSIKVLQKSTSIIFLFRFCT